MAGTRIADLLIKIGADGYEFTQATKRVEDRMQKMSKKLTSFGKTFSMAVSAPLTALAAVSVKNADTQLKAEAKVRQAIKQTQGAAKLSFEELTKYASDLQKDTLFGDEEILNNATAQLLTFTNIAGENFKKAQAAALDLATLLDGDLKGASIQLGKALNDPVKGLSALGRSGIQFSAEQQAVIKSLAETNRLSEAQSIILAEINKQYGGQAEALAKTGAGGVKQLSNAWGDFTEKIGTAILPLLKRLTSFLSGVVDWLNSLNSSTMSWVVGIGGLVAAIGPLTLGLGAMIKLLPLLKTGFAALMGPIGIAISAISALAAAWIFASQKQEAYAQGINSELLDKYRALSDEQLQAEYETQKKSDPNAFNSMKNQGFYKLGRVLNNFEISAFGLSFKPGEDQAAAQLYRNLNSTITTYEESLKALEQVVNERAEQKKAEEDLAKALAQAQANAGNFKIDMSGSGISGSDKISSGESIKPQAVEIPYIFKPLVSIDTADWSIPKSLNKITDFVRNSLFAWADKTSEVFVERSEAIEGSIASYRDKLMSKGADIAAATDEAITRIGELLQKSNELLNTALSGMLVDIFGGIGSAIAGGDFGLQDLLDTILSAIGSFMTQLGTYLIEAGVLMKAFQKALAFLVENPALAVVAGAALVAAGAAITAGVQKRAQENPPALANGGLAYGPTYAMVGDNVNAGVDPEVIAPLSKLKSIMGSAGGNQNLSINITGELRAKGRDLALSLNNENYRIKLTRG